MTYLLEIESLDIEGRGVGHHEGKVVFVDRVLPGETALVETVRSKASYDKARVVRLVTRSTQRLEPPCPSFELCGGCVMQHLQPGAQVAVKQRVLEDALHHIGGVKAQTILPAMHGPYWGYRYRARFSARLVNKKGGMLVGFRERSSRYVADMHECLILPPHVSALLTPLRGLIEGLSTPDRIPQIEVAVGEDCTALVLRHLNPLTSDDIAALHRFAEAHSVIWWLQPKGPETMHPLNREDADRLYYDLPEYGLRMPFKPADFTQVNPDINRALIQRALTLLAVQAGERVADLFCGLGNFSLPIARTAATVVGIEGSASLTERAGEAALAHGLQDKASFGTLNLFEVDVNWLRELGYFDRILIDPPRDGAFAVAKALVELTPAERPKRIVYVSCNPASLARDAGVLVSPGAYRLSSAGVINMFPHTGHVESIAVFDACEA
ncbi:23S rRNA (uracil(1939)-C(5))-methyltransferase RlmD [Paenalcaligenes niemegkensis]|uniref:23S rRNA (uracil(1939)-C(5))-methyltransferase RlmD n=1 Tax=Paenalcaligenes niemegkensis TaxID=2895469 RepID=UPI001EE924BF|nr:23S rRNA (uracil(1939)-C(5))-methyltransferase RlmD [Paenalcaligenes niemegkensis]MCQ9616245.1 23S rRNA (uracil(1939)-C(5))-methyltransferase RlmD [Paenalcaligenes niemegkensis]